MNLSHLGGQAPGHLRLRNCPLALRGGVRWWCFLLMAGPFIGWAVEEVEWPFCVGSLGLLDDALYLPDFFDFFSF